MTSIKKLYSFFSQKSQFEHEIAMCGFRFNDTLKQELKELKNSNEFNKELISKYILIRSEEHFSNSIRKLLSDLEFEVNDKVNIAADANSKSEFLFLNIQKLSELTEKIEQLIEQYPKINLDKLLDKGNLFFKTLNIQDTKKSKTTISDDIIDEMVCFVKKMGEVKVSNDILVELFDIDNSDIYMRCLYKTYLEVSNTIQCIISENNQLLIAKYNILEERPFLIFKEQPQVYVKTKTVRETPKTFEELFYNIDFVNPCIDILKELKSPFIDTDYNYIGKSKGVYCVWIEELKKQGIIKHYSERKIYASLIPTKIKGFSIDESMFGKHHSRAEILNLTDIKTKVSNIKLSQVSQKEN